MNDYITMDSEISLRDYIDLLRRRRATIVGTFVTVLVIGLIITLISRPMYRTDMRIMVDRRSNVAASYNASDPMRVLPPVDAGHDLGTQLEILQGSEMMQRGCRIAAVPSGSVTMEAKQVGTTDIIELAVQAQNPEYVNRFARALPAALAQFFTEGRHRELAASLEFARKRMEEEKIRLRIAERKLEAVRKRTRTYTVDSERERRLAERNAADLDVQRLGAVITADETRLVMVERERVGLAEYVTTPVVVSSAETDTLKDKLADLEDERARLLLKYNPSHPKVEEQNTLIGDLNRRLKNAQRNAQATMRSRNPARIDADRVIADLRVTLAANKTLLAKLNERARAATDRLVAYGNGEPQQVALEKEASKARDRIAFLGNDVDDLRIQQKGEHNPVTIVAPAILATELSPRSARNLIYPAIIGLVLGLCFALLQEFLDDRIHAPEDLRRLTDAPALAYVPLVPALETRLLNHVYRPGLHARGFSLLECYRVLRSNVQFASIDSPKNSLLVASTTSGEGRSVTAANLAVALALDSKRVLLVDADLRRPTLHATFALPAEPGLTDVLVGRAPLQAVLHETGVPGLQVLAAGSLPPNPSELLNSDAMRQLHQDLKSQFDTVIYDSPPILSTADAQVLSAFVDGVLYVVQFGEAKRSAVRHAMELLSQAHGSVLGIIFNKIDMNRKRDDYYCGYYTYYQYYQANKQANKVSGQKRSRSMLEFDSSRSQSGGDSDTA